MAVSWDPTLSTGVPAIDGQHEQLFLHVDALLQAIRSGRSREEVGRTLAFLADYVQTHFTAEEALMRASAYPGYAEHHAEHEGFSRDLATLEEDHRRNGPSAGLILRVNARVTSWLREHIHRVDRPLAEHLRAARP
ncbi:bacteriohemerythrin [Anaeromyxobacter diazotrophicus]|uniref:Hemerythrin-like domain-containing protein n=1 Tax=Anaeromyxobacter diazotrophicus TaxID=2590199 RepID=A0A7I9VI56_9BACT|nr:bacteriohemerythrin [Anaeromyxobacter diazotrophicus]GEJ55707.1 hypothetical protein AMYX_04480 [Anaeromyxobacter diazotrophicus]